MKKIFKYLFFITIAFTVTSCMTDIDDFNSPKETLKGTVYDKFTGKPMMTETGHMRIKLEELSWSDTPTPQYFGNKQDGTYFNSMIFKGHYRVTLENGPFVPIDPVEIDIKGTVTQDFTVEPYLHLEITDIIQNGTSATVKFKISSEVDMYQVTDAKVFVNNTSFVGNGAYISDYGRNELDLKGMTNATIYATEHSMTIDGLKSGRKFYLRAGARVADPIVKGYNYSEIKEITIP